MALKQLINEMAGIKPPRIKFYRIDEGDVITGKFGEDRNKGFSPVEMRRIVKVLQATILSADEMAGAVKNRRERASYLHIAEDLEDMLREARHGNRTQAIRAFKQLDSEGRDLLDDHVGNSGKTVYSYFGHTVTPKRPLRNKFTIRGSEDQQ